MTDSTDPAQGEKDSTGGPASKHDDDPDETDRSPRSERADQDHLRGVEDGCGCAEVWEHLSEQREENRNTDPTPATGED